MLLHLIRHGHALPADDDFSRPLSGHGRADVIRLAQHLRTCASGPPAHIWHSPLRRAEETAALLAQNICQPVTLEIAPHLQPEDDPAHIVRALAEPFPSNLAIVGHQPHLGDLASLLVLGRLGSLEYQLQTASLLTFTPLPASPTQPAYSRWEVRGAWSPGFTPSAA